MDDAEPNAVQQKIKKMIISKRRINKQQPIQREHLKSNAEEDNNEKTSTNLDKKPSSAYKHRSSSLKHIENKTVLPVQQQGKKEELNIQEYLTSAFNFGFKLKQYLKTNGLDANETFTRLKDNQIFLLSLPSKLNQANPQKHVQLTQTEIISKLNKMRMMQEQKQLCVKSEKKIQDLLERRIEHLSHFSISDK